MQRIYLSDVEGKPAIFFDTGLDQRSFARTKMSQSLIEPGYIVYPDGSHKEWKAAGVNEIDGSMKVWGTPFAGKRLDTFLNEVDTPEEQTAALQAVVFSLRAKMLLGDVDSTLNPGAIFIEAEDGSKYPKGSVFFAPKNLSNRCLLIEGQEKDQYNCPDLTGMDAAAFCAGAMLYKILSKSSPYPNDKTIFQDMRDGIFFPAHLAASGLEQKLSSLIQSALLLPVKNRADYKSGTDIIDSLLNLLMDKEKNITSVPSLFSDLPKEESIQQEREKKLYFIKQNITIKVKRFAAANKNLIIAGAVCLIFLIFIIVSTAETFSTRPTTKGMDAITVVITYYDAFNILDHTLMEACVNGTGKTDINAAASLFALYRTRQAYETSGERSALYSAREWQGAGRELPALDVFGITDLSIEYITDIFQENIITYRVNYTIWSPDASPPINRIDTLTLKLDKKKNWRITDIQREER